MSERYRGTVRAPEFPAGLEWLNVEQALTLAALRGKMVLLDFWTFCCINCVHTLSQLRKLEERFPNELVVIGVHSAKFPAEGHTYNIRQAVMRHDVRHPVVNDREFLLWRAYTAKAWPTIVIIDPEGKVVGAHSGEFDGVALGDLLCEMMAGYDREGKIDRTPLEVALEKHRQADTVLSFPGKVLADPEGGRLFVADTEHHRVAVYGLQDGRLRAAYGGGEPEWKDGPAPQARFRAPQGMALRGDALYVADTENHAVRKIALDSGVVTTVAGNGKQAQPWPAAGPGRITRLNSPWDVLVIGDTLFIAMAGSHQIWTLALHSGQLELFAGDGREALQDGPRLSARLAQPSSLTTDGELLWFADSETSSIRAVPLTGNGQVSTCIGQGLFEFGDVDGALDQARLQHVLEVAAAGDVIYLADAYNNKIKVLDPNTGTVRGFAGSGEPGLHDGPAGEACFWEPGGLSVAGNFLYVADTNNHAIRRVDRRTGEVDTVHLRE
jgi:DNA-binding beta-propeller fold protein YncE